LLGYQNLVKASSRIQKFEAGGKVSPDLLAGLSSTLEVTPDEIRKSLTEDYRSWMAWANEPIRPYAVLRFMSCVYQRVELPDDALGREYKRLEATPELPCEPYAVIGGKRVQFDFDRSSVLRPIDEPDR
jgi:hypothetical protein